MAFKEISPLVDYSKKEDHFIGEFVQVKMDRYTTEKDVKECPSEEVCGIMTKLLSSEHDPQLSIISSDLRFDKYDRPTIELEIKLGNCKNLEQVNAVRRRLLQMIDESVKYINDYGYKENQ